MKTNTDIMRTYTLAEFTKYNYEEINKIQNGIDDIAQTYIDEKIEELKKVLPPKDIEQLRNYYSKTMEKYGFIKL